MTDIRDNLFGTLAVRGHFALPDQVEEAVAIQKQFEARGDRVPRLGEIMVSQGYMTNEQVKAVLQGQGKSAKLLFGEIAQRWSLCAADAINAVLEEQQQSRAQGQRAPRMGQLLVERNMLRPHQVMAILRAQGKAVVQCTGCLSRFNAVNVRPGSKLNCPKCGTTFMPHVDNMSEPPQTVMRKEDVRADITVAMPAIRSPHSQQLPSVASEVGPYRLQAKLGADHSGVLYKAFHPQTGNTVVVRVLNQAIAPGTPDYDAWFGAGQTATELDHPNLQSIVSMGTENGRGYMVSEYIEGQSLRQRLQDRGNIPSAEAVDIMIQVAEALSYGHVRHLIHGDLRPNHILVGLDGRVRLSNLGTPKYVSDDLRLLAGRGGPVPLYAPPEILINPEDADERSDLYSLCAIGYHMITGRAPQEGSDVLQAGLKYASQDVLQPRAINQRIPSYLNRLILKGLAPEPEDRYGSINALLTDLKKCRAGLLIQANEVAEIAPEVRPGAIRRMGPRKRAGTAKRRMTTFLTRGGHSSGARKAVRKTRPANTAGGSSTGSAVGLPPAPPTSGAQAAVDPFGSGVTSAVGAGSGGHQLSTYFGSQGGPGTGSVLVTPTTMGGTAASATPDLTPRPNMSGTAPAVAGSGMYQATAGSGLYPATGSSLQPAIGGRRRRPRRARGGSPEDPADVQISSTGALTLIMVLLVVVVGGLFALNFFGSRGEKENPDDGTTLALTDSKSDEELKREKAEEARTKFLAKVKTDWEERVLAHITKQPDNYYENIGRIDLFLNEYGHSEPTPALVTAAREQRAEYVKKGSSGELPAVQAKVAQLAQAFRFQEAEAKINAWKTRWGAESVGEQAQKELDRIAEQEKAMADDFFGQARKKMADGEFEAALKLADKITKNFNPKLGAEARKLRAEIEQEKMRTAEASKREEEEKRRAEEAKQREANAAARYDELIKDVRMPFSKLKLADADALFEQAGRDLVGTSKGPDLQKLKLDLDKLKSLRAKVVKAGAEDKLRVVRVKYQNNNYRVITTQEKGPIIDVDGGRVELEWDDLTRDELKEMVLRSMDVTKGPDQHELGLMYFYWDQMYEAEKALKQADQQGEAVAELMERVKKRWKTLEAERPKEEPKKPDPKVADPEQDPAPTEQDPAHAMVLKSFGWTPGRGFWEVTESKSFKARTQPDKDLVYIGREVKSFSKMSIELRGEGNAAGFSFGAGKRFLVRPTPSWQQLTVEVIAGDKLRILINGEARQGLEDISRLTTEDLRDAMFFRLEGPWAEVRNFTVDGKIIGPRVDSPFLKKGVDPVVEDTPKKPDPDTPPANTNVQDVNAEKALGILGWKIGDGLWTLRDGIAIGRPKPAAEKVVRLQREFKGAALIEVELRGYADKTGISFGKGKQFYFKPSMKWAKLTIEVDATGKLGMRLDGKLTNSAGDSSQAKADNLSATLSLVGEGGDVEFRNFRVE